MKLNRYTRRLLLKCIMILSILYIFSAVNILLVSAWTPPDDITGKNYYRIVNFTNISSSAFYENGSRLASRSYVNSTVTAIGNSTYILQSEESNLNVNSSDFWEEVDSPDNFTNLTAVNLNGGNATISTGWFDWLGDQFRRVRTLWADTVQAGTINVTNLTADGVRLNSTVLSAYLQSNNTVDTYIATNNSNHSYSADLWDSIDSPLSNWTTIAFNSTYDDYVSLNKSNETYSANLWDGIDTPDNFENLTAQTAFLNYVGDLANWVLKGWFDTVVSGTINVTNLTVDGYVLNNTILTTSLRNQTEGLNLTQYNDLDCSAVLGSSGNLCLNQTDVTIDYTVENYYNKSTVDNLIPALLTYYFWDDVSTVNSTYNVMNTTQNPDITQLVAVSLDDGDVIVYRLNKETNLTGLASGTLHLHTTATKTGGTKSLAIQGRLSRRLANGSIVLIKITDTSPVLASGVPTNINLFAAIIQQDFNIDDMLLWQLNAVIVGGGSSPSVNITVGGVTQNGLDLPVTVSNLLVTDANALKKDGSTPLIGDWATGAFNITNTKYLNAQNLTVTDTGFFAWLGSVVSRVSGLFVTQLDATNISTDVLVVAGKMINDTWDRNQSKEAIDWVILQGYGVGDSFNATYDALVQDNASLWSEALNKFNSTYDTFITQNETNTSYSCNLWDSIDSPLSNWTSIAFNSTYDTYITQNKSNTSYSANLWDNLDVSTDILSVGNLSSMNSTGNITSGRNFNGQFFIAAKNMTASCFITAAGFAYC